MAGLPYAVKNLFDIAGVTTLAGSVINRELPPAGHDAVLVQRLRAADAVLAGALDMDEYACGFTTENSHYGRCSRVARERGPVAFVRMPTTPRAAKCLI